MRFWEGCPVRWGSPSGTGSCRPPSLHVCLVSSAHAGSFLALEVPVLTRFANMRRELPPHPRAEQARAQNKTDKCIERRNGQPSGQPSEEFASSGGRGHRHSQAAIDDACLVSYPAQVTRGIVRFPRGETHSVRAVPRIRFGSSGAESLRRFHDCPRLAQASRLHRHPPSRWFRASWPRIHRLQLPQLPQLHMTHRAYARVRGPASSAGCP